MPDTLVVYRSRYGATRQYARWIADALEADCIPVSRLKETDLAPYRTVVHGGGLYAGGILGLKKLLKQSDALAGKALVLFTCGLADPDSDANVVHIRREARKLLSPEMEASIRFFHLRGGIDYGRLSFKHRAMMGMLRRMLQKKDPSQRTAEDEGILETYGRTVDFADPDSIAPLVAYCQGVG